VQPKTPQRQAAVLQGGLWSAGSYIVGETTAQRSLDRAKQHQYCMRTENDNNNGLSMHHTTMEWEEERRTGVELLFKKWDETQFLDGDRH